MERKASESLSCTGLDVGFELHTLVLNMVTRKVSACVHFMHIDIHTRGKAAGVATEVR